MEAFLNSLAKHLYEKHGKSLGGYCIVFPNRRSGTFFKNYLRSLTVEGLWMPEIFTINDFMEKLSQYEPADPIELSFMTYHAYCSMINQPESYDEFYHWGEMMLSDFDDIDKYLVDAGDIFSNIIDLKLIESHFDYLTKDQKELIARFWHYFEKAEISSQKESFLSIWKLLLPIYEKLRAELQSKQLAYEGMIYREVATRIEKEDYPDIPWDKVIVAGFNAINNAEKRLFNYLMKSGKADFYWDYDKSYIESRLPEAGRFLRENIKAFPEDPDFEIPRDNLSGRKKITIFELPSDVLQTKQLYHLLEDPVSPGPTFINDTAVILSDESLLLPVLTSLPPNIAALNITMGFPITATPVFSFVEGLMQLQRNLSSRKMAEKFFYRDVLSILNHQYLKLFSLPETKSIISEINKRNRIYLEKSFFNESILFSLIFRKIEVASDMPEYIASILSYILAKLREEGQGRIEPSQKHGKRKEIQGKGTREQNQEQDLKQENREQDQILWNQEIRNGKEKMEDYIPEQEYIFQIMTRLNKMKEIFHIGIEDLTVEGFNRLFRKILSSHRIPFEGEPLQGLQIMGVLESRLLDFKNLIVLSLNEGVMPASQRSYSYIPVNLRYGFGLPTQEEHDAVYAYYFYRLLQRAENISILYNSKTEGLRSGEPGRYIHQLKYLYGYDTDFKTVSFRIAEKKPVDISVQKTAGVLEKLQAFSSTGRRYLSPSAITTYLDCSLRFYFNQIAEIWEEDEASEEVDAPGFGQLYHNCMENLYMEHTSQPVTIGVLDQMSDEKNIRAKLDKSFREEFYRTEDPEYKVKPEGRNIIIYEIIRKLVVQTLQQDKKFTEFNFLNGEEEVRYTINDSEKKLDVRLGGKIDRVDERDGSVFLIDYKTGKAANHFKGLAHLFDRDSWGASENYKAPLQILMYSWLYSKLHPGKTVVPGIYRTSELFSEEFDPFLEDKSLKSRVMNFSLYEQEFEGLLMSLIQEIFNPELPFTQTTDENRCKNCPFADICHRQKD